MRGFRHFARRAKLAPVKPILRYALRVVGLVLLLGLLFVARFTYRVYSPPEAPLPLPGGLVAADSDEGRARLARATAVDDAVLGRTFETQVHGSFCGIASSVAVLNGLSLGPVTQSSFFDARTQPIQTYLEAFFGGVTLDELGALLEARGAHVRVVHETSGGLASFRDRARENLAHPGDFVVVNFDRRVLAEEGGGHFSPLAAYDAQSDSFLVLDTASYKYPPTWVPAELLHRAMATRDSSASLTRGYVEVSR